MYNFNSSRREKRSTKRRMDMDNGDILFELLAR